MDRFPDYKFENNILYLYFFNLESDYDEVGFFDIVYYSINNVEMYYKYKLRGCYELNKKNGSHKKYNYDIEIQFEI